MVNRLFFRLKTFCSLIPEYIKIFVLSTELSEVRESGRKRHLQRLRVCLPVTSGSFCMTKCTYNVLKLIAEMMMIISLDAGLWPPD